MKTVRLTLKNYRGFTDFKPCRIEIGPGFTALLGPNNSGNSSLKLFFYELRDLFANLANLNTGVLPNAYDALFGQGVPINYRGITDIDELFNNGSSTRPITIEFEILNPQASSLATTITDCLTKVVATCERANPQQWSFSTYGTESPLNLSRLGYSVSSRNVVEVKGIGSLDCGDFFDAMYMFRDAKYYGPFRNAINQGSGDHFDMKIGTAFIDLWNDWKTSGVKSKTLAINQQTRFVPCLSLIS
jgi:hypothetical protein